MVWSMSARRARSGAGRGVELVVSGNLKISLLKTERDVVAARCSGRDRL
jgi:hypothetical protein